MSMMGSLVSSPSEDGAVALLKVIGDPKAYEQKLEELKARTEEARAAEEKLAETRKAVTEGRAKLETDTADLKRRNEEFEAESRRARRWLDRDTESLKSDQDALAKERGEHAEQVKKSQAALNDRQSQIDGQSARLGERESEIKRREMETKVALDAAGRERTKAERLRGDLEKRIDLLKGAIERAAA